MRHLQLTHFGLIGPLLVGVRCLHHRLEDLGHSRPHTGYCHLHLHRGMHLLQSNRHPLYSSMHLLHSSVHLLRFLLLDSNTLLRSIRSIHSQAPLHTIVGDRGHLELQRETAEDNLDT